VFTAAILLALLAHDAHGASPGAESDEELARADDLDAAVLETFRAGEYLRALERAQEVVALRENLQGPEALELSRSLVNLGVVLNTIDRVDEALECYTRALAIRERVSGPNHEDVARVLDGIAGVEIRRRDWQSARRLLERAAAIWEGSDDTGGEAHSLATLGTVMHALGEPSEAIRLTLEAIALTETDPEPFWTGLADLYGSLGTIYAEQGRYELARPAYERSLEIYRSELGPRHPDVAIAESNLAALSQDQGDHGAARLLYKSAYVTLNDALGPSHPVVDRIATNLALSMLELGETTGAMKILEDSLALRREVLGARHPGVADALNDLAGVYETVDELNRAAELYQGACDIWETAGGGDVALCLRNLGRIRARQEDHQAAASLYERALEIHEATLVEGHMEIATTRFALAGALNALGQRERARPLASQAAATQRSFVDRVLRGMSEREAMVFVAIQRFSMVSMLEVFTDDGDARVTYDVVLHIKGLVGRLLEERREARWVADDPELDDLHKKLKEVRRSISGLAFDSSGTDEVAQLTSEKDDLERALAARSVDFRARLDWARVDLDAVCAAIPSGSVVVDYLRFHSFPKSVYVAYVLDSSCEPIRVDLGDAQPVESALTRWREALAAPDSLTSRIDDRGAAVHDLIWAPVAAHIGTPDHVFVVPDAALASLPFPALPVGTDRYLIETLRLSSLDSATDLLRLTDPPRQSSGALVVGGADYGPEELASAIPCVGGPWSALPATAGEADDVIARFSRRHPREPAERLSGRDATEDAVTQALGGQRVVHLATHGFFANPERCQSLLNGGLDPAGYNPLVLSGLILAGANHEGDPAAHADGILTAEEVATLDLRGTQLVVLSACETGLGKTRSGSGVLGLRSAFAASGVRSLLMSLWAVPDEPTSQLMQTLYAGLLRRRPRSTTRALRDAQLTLLEDNRRRFGEGRPQEWGAFILAGDWR